MNPCANCEGTGTVEMFVDFAYTILGVVPCWRCGGSGKDRVPVTEQAPSTGGVLAGVESAASTPDFSSGEVGNQK